MNGTLTVCPTPIGNLDDVTPRQREALTSADIIACEDTRTTGKLLQLLGIDRVDRRPKLVSYHDHSEQDRTDSLIAFLQEGKNVTLVSDAGTPTISDPGFRLVSQASAASIRVVPLPGPFAGAVALSASGLSTNRFMFEGFLGSKSGERKKRLGELKGVGSTVIFYESPKRVSGLVADIADVLGPDVRVCVARELTKKFETFYHGTPAEVLETLEHPLKGECVVLVEVPSAHAGVERARELTRSLFAEGVAPATIKAVVRDHYGVSKSDIFTWLEELKS